MCEFARNYFWFISVSVFLQNGYRLDHCPTKTLLSLFMDRFEEGLINFFKMKSL